MDEMKPDIQTDSNLEIVQILLEKDEESNKIAVEPDQTKVIILEESNLVKPKPDFNLSQTEMDEPELCLIQENPIKLELGLVRIKEDNIHQHNPVELKPDSNLAQTKVNESVSVTIQKNSVLPEMDMEQIKENNLNQENDAKSDSIINPKTSSEPQTDKNLDGNKLSTRTDLDLHEIKSDGLDDNITVEHGKNVGSDQIKLENIKKDCQAESEPSQIPAQNKEDKNEKDLLPETFGEPESDLNDLENIVEPKTDLISSQIKQVESEPDLKRKSSPGMSEVNIVPIPSLIDSEKRDETDVKIEIDRVADVKVAEALDVKDIVENPPEPDPSRTQNAAVKAETHVKSTSTYDPRRKDREMNCMLSALINIVDFFF